MFGFTQPSTQAVKRLTCSDVVEPPAGVFSIVLNVTFNLLIQPLQAHNTRCCYTGSSKSIALKFETAGQKGAQNKK